MGIKKVYRNQEDVAGILTSNIGPGNPPIGRTDILPYVLISSFLDFKDLQGGRQREVVRGRLSEGGQQREVSRGRSSEGSRQREVVRGRLSEEGRQREVVRGRSSEGGV